MIDKLGGRKFIGFIVVAILLAGLAAVGRIPFDTFVTFVTANFGIYVAGNAAEHVTEAM